MSTNLTPEQVADVLDDAADYIEEHGWCRGPVDDDGGVCVITALCFARQRLDINASVAPAYHAFKDVIGGQHIDVIAWNDDTARTTHQVLDAFRLAAKQQRLRSP